MSSDFTGLRVIWPPDRTRPPNHDHDIIFVHGLHHGSVTDWQDEDGICWPAEHLSLDLGNARILAFGYDHSRLNVQCDGLYQGGLIFQQGRNFWNAVNTSRRTDKVEVPLTLVGHGTGGILIKSALCISHLFPGQLFNVLLRKTKHVVFLSTPHEEISWDDWRNMSHDSPSTNSKGRWKVWSAALDSTNTAFGKISHRFNITSAVTDDGIFSQTPKFARSAHECHMVLEGTNHRTISRLSRGSNNYKRLLARLQDPTNLSMKHPGVSQRILEWLGRRPDQLNRDTHQVNLNRSHPGTGQWLFDDPGFRGWASLEREASPVLLLMGPNGCGNSVLCSLAAERLRTKTNRPAVLYLSMAFDRPRSEYHFTAQLAIQLLEYIEEHQGGVDSEVLFIAPSEQDETKKLVRVRALIKALISQCPAVYVFLDGLDQAYQPEDSDEKDQDAKETRVSTPLRSTLSFLEGLARSNVGTPLRLWCNSPNTDLTKQWMEDLRASKLRLDEAAIEEDVAAYLAHEIESVVGKEHPSKSWLATVDNLTKAVGSSFLVASVIRDMLQVLGDSAEAWIQRLACRPQVTVDELYEECWEHLQQSNRAARDNPGERQDLALEILSLVTFAKRPLKLREVEEALAINGKHWKGPNLVAHEIDKLDRQKVHRICAPFVSLSPCHDTADDYTLRLSHVSAYDFLKGLSNRTVSEADEISISPEFIAQTCLKYLSQERYTNTNLQTVEGHAFFLYAAKYWHRHADEAGPSISKSSSSFMQSLQFLGVTRLQSLFLHRHFSQSIEDGDDSTATAANVPQALGKLDVSKSIHDEYADFVREWGEFLQLGVTNLASRGDIGRCFWGALGKDTVFQAHASAIEKQQSFLLQLNGPGVQSQQLGNASAHECFYQSISDDGNRVAVWTLPIYQGHVYDTPTPSQITLKRQSWYIDGRRPPFPYGPQETLTINTEQVRWDSYDSTSGRRFPLIPIMDNASRVPALDEHVYGAEVRIGRLLFRRERRGLWVPSNKRHLKNDEYWEEVTTRGPWTVRSRRKFLQIDDGKKAKSSEVETHDQSQDKSLSDSSGQDANEDAFESANGTSAAKEPGNKRVVLQTHSPFGTVTTFIRDPNVETPPEKEEPEPEYASLSSAESFCADSPLASDSAHDSSDEFWVSDETVNGSEDENGDKSDESASASDSDASSQSSPESKTEASTLSTSKAKKLLSSGRPPQESEADSNSKEESKETPQPVVAPLHQFSWRRWCDLCSRTVVSLEYRDLMQREHFYYQCSACGDPPVDSYDICSDCFNKGSWCKDDVHLLSKATFHVREKRITWQDGISKQAAVPVVTIVAESIAVKGRQTLHKPSFSYRRRWNSMLHESRSVIHPSLPLLVYPLDGREFLFGNLNDNTYFTHEVPFDSKETAETGGSTCVPISVNMRFSACGRYLHVVRFTARNDSAMLGPMRLYATLITIALSSKDICSGRPRTLGYRQGADLGVWLRLVSQMPFTVTWTTSDVFVSMSDSFLQVLRFPLRIEDNSVSSVTHATDGVSMLSQQVPLPRSALSRPIYFYPSTETKSARIILGAVAGPRPRSPVVVYLNIDNEVDWVKAQPGKISSIITNSLQVRPDAMIEEPYPDDDSHLVVRERDPDRVATLEPIQTCGIKDWLEAGFKRIGVYCPSCFDLGTQLAFLRPPPYMSVYNFDPSLQEDVKFKLHWKVKVQSLIEALKAGCQFCCYVATRMLSFSHVTHTTQYIGAGGTRCCPRGSTIKDPSTVQTVLDNLERIEWHVKPEDRMLIFECHPINQDLESMEFSKLAIRMPSMTVGAKGENAKFMPTLVMLRGENDEGETQTITSFIHSSLSKHGTPECVLEMYSLPDDAAHHFTDTRPLTTARGGDENLSVVEGWLKDCGANHAFCRRHDNTKASLPTRLIEIIDGETAQLIETNGQVGKYVALSYCWGPNPEENSKTTTANVGNRLRPKSLPRDAFPAAIKDAITVSERLGIKYIWVDAFCIIQDDPRDKELELGNMSRYYKNSHLTIAVSTPRCTAGFTGTSGRCEQHPDSPLPRDLVPLDFFALYRDIDHGKSGKLYVREENPYHLAEEHINRRAWTLQECVLAPRVLMFGSRVMWFCQHSTRSDGGVEDWSFDESDLEGTRRQFQMELNKLDREEEEGGSKAPLSDVARGTASTNDGRDVYDLWHRIVQSYSRRGITHSSDKFPAISAIAAEFSRLSGDDYLAGSWRATLPRDLLWTTPDPATHKPVAWRAPTWSWASVDDTILYTHPPPKDATLFIEVNKAETVPLAAEVPFGEIGRACLEITGPSLTIKARPDEDRSKFSAPWLQSFQMQGGSSERYMLLEALKRNYRLDKASHGAGGEGGDGKKDDFVLPEEVTVVLFYGKRDELVRSKKRKADTDRKQDNRWTTWGLLLKPVMGEDGEMYYERVLSFSGLPMNLEDEEIMKTQRSTIRMI